jgi:hypothetical protein
MHMNIVPTPRKILGAMGFFDETEFEKEKPLSSVLEAFVDLGKKAAFPTKGTIEFKKNQEHDQKEKEETDRKRTFFQRLKEEMDRVQKAKDKLLFEQELDDLTRNLPTEQKNEILGYQLSYRDRSVYQIAALRSKLAENRRKQQEKEKATSIPSPAKQPSALEGAFEGRSGQQGGGTSNLSAMAVG